ncbi:hypothetical protein [Tumebacillus flagellatus]|uniref:DUF2197 domain-containing protein n=1 Tax=Tumebacillus flagellatus TaxID=1157490 RepID=A0A074LTD1_9BACL|nr:hypothetical protein [Tumebacillus flagellatus]KEO84299.1 hypothetical protein EL26_05900 [Tumebacillus flagellatus]
MISYTVPCYFCKQNFEVFEGSPEYQMVKRNMQARHTCHDCRKKIEMESKKATGLSNELIAMIESDSLEGKLNKYDELKGKGKFDLDPQWLESDRR